jgi:CBS domain containing-hemolysin-like protein
VIVALLLLAASAAMSAFFSGTETGFYRLSRMRLVMETLAGDRAARLLLWFANQPSVLVATTLVGNNVASDLSSFASVQISERLFPGGGTLAAVLLPVLVTPLLFICGDLLPKNVFYNAPHRLMGRCTPLLVVSAVLFAPITFLLWLLSLVLRLFSNEGAQEIRLTLARRELNAMLVEGSEAGILRPVQRSLAQTMLAVAGQPVKNFATPAGRVVRATITMSRSEMLRIAQRHRRVHLPLEDDKRRLVGFVRTFDLFLGDGDKELAPEPIVEIGENETFLSALGKLDVASDALGHVVNAAGKTVGFVSGSELRQALLRPQ